MKKLIYGNWKMNLNAAQSAKIATTLTARKWVDDLEVAIFPTFTSLEDVHRALGRDSRVRLGAQDCFWEERGAFTGEVSVTQLKELGCTHVLIGHSERRRYLGETDEMVNKKVKAAKAAGLAPVLCIGESSADRQNGSWSVILERQVVAGLTGVDLASSGPIIIAYEPIWAIGTGKPCDPVSAGEAHMLVRGAITENFGASAAQKNIRIIYGGSVDAGNIADFLRQDGVDGALVGGASQDPDKFTELLSAASAAVLPNRPA